MPQSLHDPKRCACTRSYDAAAWSALPFVGVMRDEVEPLELRNCVCGSTLAVQLCAMSFCPERATWQADNRRDYCEAHAREWLMAERAAS